MYTHNDVFNLIDKLATYEANALFIDDEVDFIQLKGKGYSGCLNLSLDLFLFFKSINAESALSIRINDEEADETTVSYYKNDEEVIEWNIRISKSFLFNDSADLSFLFFLNKIDFSKWADTIDIFEQECFLNKHSRIDIIVKGLDGYIAGPLLRIYSHRGKEFDGMKYNIPDVSVVKEQVHIITSGNTVIDPLKYLITEGDTRNSCFSPFVKASILTLASALVNEFYGKHKIVIKGIKRVEMPLESRLDEYVDEGFIQKLIHVVRWVYEERVETRSKLLMDRISLDASLQDSFIKNLYTHIDNAFKQSKEQYGFVILERKDEYVKEFRNLLSEVQKQTELYSTKTRTLSSNLLRDVLAILLVLAFTIFPKIDNVASLSSNELFAVIFKVIAGYFIISIGLQLFVNYRDLFLSRKEIKYWITVTRNYMSNDDVELHINKSIKARRSDYHRFNTLFFVLYFTLAVVFYKLPSILTMLFI